MGNNKSLDLYHDETGELLQLIERKLLELEKNPQDHEIIDEIFRALHTIKGSGSMFGLDRIAGFTHEVESVFDLIRKKIIRADREIINLTLKAKDHIGILLNDPDAPVTEEEKNILASFKNVRPGKQSETSKANEKTELPDKDGQLKIFRIYFKPDHDILLRGVSLYPLLMELSGLGEALVIPYYNEIPEIQDIVPDSSYMSWSIILSTYKSIDDIRDVFIFVEDYCKLNIEQVYYDPEEAEIGYKKIGEILLENREITEGQITEILNEGKRFGKIAVEKGFTTKEVIESVLDEQNEIKKVIKKKRDQDETSTIRVKYKKLDDLVNYIGELVTLQAQISQYSLKNRDQGFGVLAESLDRLTSELRDHSMELRMIPIEETFSGIFRIVRDLSKSLGKEVGFITNGGETELDKTIIDELKDPLIHIVRNAIDHGIEPPDTRKEKGKPAAGAIVISVFNEGSNVMIKVTDDGAGLDVKTIRAKALEKGLIKPSDVLTDGEIRNLIFLPGFSTVSNATEVSGRGVGMDIVKRNVENLRGTIEINSVKDAGTTIILKIPLTLAIIDGLLMNIEDEKYIMNLSLINECVDLTKEIIEKAGDKKVINLRGEPVPYISLRKVFYIEGAAPDIQQMVILNLENRKIGFVVDNILGQHKIVLKSIGKVFNRMEDVSGATILGDGTVALVLDAFKIYKKEIKQ